LHNSATSTVILHTFEKYPKYERDNFCSEERRIITWVGEIVCSILSFYSINRIRFYPPRPITPAVVAVAIVVETDSLFAQNLFILTAKKSNKENHQTVTELER